MKKCNPKSCTCEDEEIEVNFNEIKEKAKFFKRRFNKFKKICPNDQPPVSCQCNAESEKGKSIEPPFENVLEFLDCLPQSCTCESGEIVTTKRNKPFERFSKLCGSKYNFGLNTCIQSSIICLYSFQIMKQLKCQLNVPVKMVLQ